MCACKRKDGGKRVVQRYQQPVRRTNLGSSFVYLGGAISARQDFSAEVQRQTPEGMAWACFGRYDGNLCPPKRAPAVEGAAAESWGTREDAVRARHGEPGTSWLRQPAEGPSRHGPVMPRLAETEGRRPHLVLPPVRVSIRLRAHRDGDAQTKDSFSWCTYR